MPFYLMELTAFIPVVVAFAVVVVSAVAVFVPSGYVREREIDRKDTCLKQCVKSANANRWTGKIDFQQARR